MSLFGKRFLINCGTSQYEAGEIRMKERGTAAHNTVVINNENSSEIWSSFRVGRRAKPINLSINQNKTCINVSCSHNGYNRFSNNLLHKRFWVLKKTQIEVKDKIFGKFKKAKAYYHFHPTIKIKKLDKYNWSLKIPKVDKLIKLTALKALYFSRLFIKLKNYVPA